MNKTKLSALCAKARGISPAEMAAICYDPLDDANQADDLLEYVAFNLGCSWSCGYYILTSEYWCEIPTAKDVFCENNRTQNLAKILCTLRASDKVTDAEINDAMEGE